MSRHQSNSSSLPNFRLFVVVTLSSGILVFCSHSVQAQQSFSRWSASSPPTPTVMPPTHSGEKPAATGESKSEIRRLPPIDQTTDSAETSKAAKTEIAPKSKTPLVVSRFTSASKSNQANASSAAVNWNQPTVVIAPKTTPVQPSGATPRSRFSGPVAARDTSPSVRNSRFTQASPKLPPATPVVQANFAEPDTTPSASQPVFARVFDESTSPKAAEQQSQDSPIFFCRLLGLPKASTL